MKFYQRTLLGVFAVTLSALIIYDFLIPLFDPGQAEPFPQGIALILLALLVLSIVLIADSIRDRQQAQGVLQQQVEQQRLVMQITQRIRQSLHLQDILQTTVEEVRQLLKCDRVIVFQFSPDWQGTVVVESVGSEWTAILSTEIYDPCFGKNDAEPYKQGLITVKSDIHNAGIDPCHLQLLSNFQVRANLVVGIPKGDELWGLLIAHQCASPRQWQSSEIDLMQQIASQASIALQQVALLEQLQTELAERKQAELALLQLNTELEQRVQERTAAFTEVNDRLLAALLALRESEERRRLALDLTHTGFWDWHIPSGSNIWNDNLFTLLGLVPYSVEPSYEVWRSCVHPDEVAKIEAQFLASIANQTDYTAEYRLVHPDGSVHWVMARAKAIYSESGEPVRSLGVLLDISDRKSIEVERQRADAALQLAHTQLLQRTEQLEKVNLELHQALEELQIAEEQLRRSNHELETTILAVQLQRQRYEDLFNFAPDGYLVTDSHGIVQEANQAAGNLLHRDSSILVGKPLATYIGKEDKLRFRTYLAELQPLWGRQTYELTIQPHQLKTFPAAIAASTIRNPQGQILSIRWLIQDISDRKQAEESLRRSEAKFRSLSEASPVGIFMTDIQGHCIYTNPCCQRICGYTFEEALGEGWLQFIHPEERQKIAAEWFKAVSQRQEFFGETCYVRKDGSLCFGRVRSAPLFSDTGELMGYVGTIEDITESRAIETMKDEFISIVSHELRTPLTAIRGSLGLLASGVLNDKPEVARQMVEIASQDTERLVRLVNDILDLERLESQRVRLNLQWWDAATLLEKSVKTVQSLAAESDISILIEPTSAQVWADGDLLIQTLVNLIGNAIKFSPPNTTVTLKVQDRDDRVLFQVSDRGRGIPADQLEKIFGQFQQVDASDSRQKGGTGLGLAICKSIIQQHGGAIWAESQLGEGSHFYFTVPKPIDSERFECTELV